MNPATHTCDCGFTWRHGHSGAHSCEPYYRKTIAELRAAAPQVVADDEMSERELKLLSIAQRFRMADIGPELKAARKELLEFAAAPVQAQVSLLETLVARDGAYDDAVEDIAHALAHELEDSALDSNDLVTVNRAKLILIAERMLAKAATAPVQPVAVPDGKRIEYLESLVSAYGPKSLQYDIEHPNDGLNSQDAAEVERTMRAAPAAQGDAIRKVEIDDQGPLGVVTKMTYRLANAGDAKDAERLEFVVNNSNDIGFSSNPGGEWFVLDKKTLYPFLKSTFTSARAAIDAAIAAKAAS